MLRRYLRHILVAASSCGLLLAAASERTAAQGVGVTQPLAAIAGNYAKNPPGLYGTDLGFSFLHGGKLWMLFGDSWKSKRDNYLGDLVSDFLVAGDDAIGFIDLSRPEFASGASLEAFAASHRVGSGLPWQVDAPLLQATVAQRALPITAYRNGTLIQHMGPGQTPITGFSNARKDDKAAAFGIFFRNNFLKCSDGCGEFTCDSGLGRCIEEGQSDVTDLSAPCVVGETPRYRLCDRCVKVDGGGFCQDKKSSMYDETPRGRASAAVVTQEVGCATGSNDLSRSEPSRSFDTQPWNTNRFFNAMARSVNDFDPSRAAGSGNDFSAADGVDPEKEGVLLWGRPHFGGNGKEKRDVQLYLAWAKLPEYAESGRFTWDVKYFAGLDDQGRPQFKDKQTESVALDLSGPNDDGASEVVDVVGQLTISYLPSMRRWIMIYGGGLSEQFGALIFGEDWSTVERNGIDSGPLYMRTAQEPWGPWTAPRALLDPGDPASASGLYAPGGILHSPSCRGNCVASEEAWSERGGLYAPNIIEPWITTTTTTTTTTTSSSAQGGSIDLYWNLSTWNPYEVVLMKSTLSAAELQ